jgi:flavocytochrome c
MGIFPATDVSFDLTVPVAIIGAGACGMVAALAVKDEGVEPVVFERDLVPMGSTALSSGMIPACETSIQAEKNVADTVAAMAADIQRKAKGEACPDLVDIMCRTSGPAIDWLSEKHQIELRLVEGFLYPGHSFLRMHAPASRIGRDLIGSLTRAVARAKIEVMTNARVTGLFVDSDGRVRGFRLLRPDGGNEYIGCETLILANNGFGGNPDMIRRYIPDMAEAQYFGHDGNQGDAVIWGEALGAATQHLGSYQGHGSVAHPHGILISWALMMEGGFQINDEGRRFSNEHSGYSEQARIVLAQPGGVAWDIFDARLYGLGQDFEEFRQAETHGAVRRAETAEELAKLIGVPAEVFMATLAETQKFAAAEARDTFGRNFSNQPPLNAPFYAIKVTGALFHTQGGLVVDRTARVRRKDGTSLPNLFAGGGAACGVSGSSDDGYLSGNGLLAAVTLGRLAGANAALQVANRA